jgi:hypothetical protein
MPLGFVSAILPEMALAEVLGVAAKIGYACVEVMCWPPSRAERRYAGVTHVDVGDLSAVRGERHPQGDLIAAGRVHVMHLRVEGLPKSAVMRVLVVVQDHVLVHLLESHVPGPRSKNAIARRTPAISRSTSSAVL